MRPRATSRRTRPRDRRTAERLAGAVATAALLAALAAPPAAAAERRLTVDAEASRIGFTLGATLHTVSGSARVAAGSVTFEPATGEMAGAIVVDATSADTGNRKRDRDMHEKVLESATHPRIVFRPSRFEGELAAAGESHLTVHGSLEIHGGEHPLAAEVRVTLDGGRARAVATFEVPYVEWGMRDPSKLFLRVAKQVTVTAELAAALD